jgi:hypothetical protein
MTCGSGFAGLGDSSYLPKRLIGGNDKLKFVDNSASLNRGKCMATYTPPPYFPQNSLSPANPKKYRKFKLAIAGAGLLLLLVVGGVILGLFYLLKWLF